MQREREILYGAVSRQVELEQWIQRFSQGRLPLVLAVDLQALPLSLGQLRGALTVEECAGIQRLQREADRARAIVSRGLLRLVLARLQACRADEVELRQGRYGKPHLVAPTAMEFSVSRSADCVMLALSHEGRIGVDVERIRSLADFDRLLTHCLMPAEQAEINQLPPGDARQQAFFSAWTQKEAFLKGIGCGLSLAPTALRVACLPHATPQLLQVDGMAEAARAWQLIALPRRRGYAAVLAVEQGAAGYSSATNCPSRISSKRSATSK